MASAPRAPLREGGSLLAPILQLGDIGPRTAAKPVLPLACLSGRAWKYLRHSKGLFLGDSAIPGTGAHVGLVNMYWDECSAAALPAHRALCQSACPPLWARVGCNYTADVSQPSRLLQAVLLVICIPALPLPISFVGRDRHSHNTRL